MAKQKPFNDGRGGITKTPDISRGEAVRRSNRVFDDDQFHRQCFGKKRFTAKAAKSAAKKWRKRQVQSSRDPGGDWCIFAYKCCYCGYWHTGHNPGKGISLGKLNRGRE